MTELEKAARVYIGSHPNSKMSYPEWDGVDAYDSFIAGAQWQKEEPSRALKLQRYQSAEAHKYCDTCEHFRPDGEDERKPVDELCEFVRPLIFKAPSDYDFIYRNDWGFYLPGCKDYKQSE